MRYAPASLALLFLVACGGSSDSSGPTLVSATPDELAMEDLAHSLINFEREANSLAPLVHDEQLRAVARAHSQDMVRRGYFAHVDPDGDGPADRLAAAGVTYAAMGENIAWNYGYADPAATAVDGWMDSPGHRANILNGTFTHTGMGVAMRGGGAWFFTQVFTLPAGNLVAVSWTAPAGAIATPATADQATSSWTGG